MLCQDLAPPRHGNQLAQCTDRGRLKDVAEKWMQGLDRRRSGDHDGKGYKGKNCKSSAVTTSKLGQPLHVGQSLNELFAPSLSFFFKACADVMREIQDVEMLERYLEDLDV